MILLNNYYMNQRIETSIQMTCFLCSQCKIKFVYFINPTLEVKAKAKISPSKVKAPTVHAISIGNDQAFTSDGKCVAVDLLNHQVVHQVVLILDSLLNVLDHLGLKC